VMQIPIEGGQSGRRITIWNKRETVTSIAADASGVYVGGVNSTGDAGGSGLIERVPHDTGQPPVLIDMGDYPSEIVLDETHVYWRSGNTTIKRWSKSGGSTASAVGDQISGLGRITAMNGRVFYHQSVGARIVQRDAQGDYELAKDEAGVNSVVARGSFVFWSLASAVKIRRATVDAGAPTDLAQFNGIPVWMAAEDNYVYWITEAPNAIRSARTSVPGAAESPQNAIDLAVGIDQPRRLGLDARCVYVTTAGVPGKILRVAKP
jgi:hypothetical protein